MYSALTESSDIITGYIIAWDDREACATVDGLIEGPCVAQVPFTVRFGHISNCPTSIVRSSPGPLAVSWQPVYGVFGDGSALDFGFSSTNGSLFDLGSTLVSSVISSALLDPDQVEGSYPSCAFEVR